MLLAIIPARSGSKRIINKNIIDFNGKPLISYALKSAKNANIFDKIHVSTDSQRYANIVKKLGFEVDFLRDLSLSGNNVEITKVLRWVVQEYEKRGEIISEICMIMATAPLVNSNDIINMRKIFLKYNGSKPVLAITSFPAPIEQGLKITDNGLLKAVFPDKFHLKTQKLLKVYQDAGALFYIGRDQLMETDTKAYTECYPFILEREKVVDIDDFEDLSIAEALYLGLKAKNKKNYF